MAMTSGTQIDLTNSSKKAGLKLKVFRIHPTRNSESLQVEDEESLTKLINAAGSSVPVADTWSPLRLRSVGNAAKSTDLPRITTGRLVGLRQMAYADLWKLLDDHGEFLQAQDLSGANIQLFHCLREIDALDNKKTESGFMTGGAYKEAQTEGVFIESLLRDIPLFCLPAPYRRDLLVTDIYRDAVRNHGLTGQTFSTVWNSEWTARPLRYARISAFWRPIEWSAEQITQLTLNLLEALGDVDPILSTWRRTGRNETRTDSRSMALTLGDIGKSLETINEGDNGSGRYFANLLWLNPQADDEFDAEISYQLGAPRQFSDIPWGAILHLKLHNLFQQRTEIMSVDGIQRLFGLIRSVFPADWLVAGLHLADLETNMEFQHVRPMLGWINWMNAIGPVSTVDPIFPDGVQILDRQPNELMIQIGQTEREATVEMVRATRQALVEHGWIDPQQFE